MIRVRFAPSPTGFLHIGGARTALFNWMYAKSQDGTFILRIEDTDKQRSQKIYEDEILESMQWLGLKWDELYRQSERFEIYREYAKKLLAAHKEDGKVYSPDYGDAIMLRMPQQEVKFFDLIRGEIKFDTSNFFHPLHITHEGPEKMRLEEGPALDEEGKKILKDIPLIKSDGSPTYNFACVIDDALMEISHVIRGEDHISNTPKQIIIYEALGFKVPKFAHLPLILDDEKARLSKRVGAVAVSDYRKQGFLPQALVNYLLLLGWSPGNNQEVIDLTSAVKKFSIKKINKAGAVFSMDKLKWVNSEYLKNMPAGELTQQLIPLLKEKKYVDQNFDVKNLENIVQLFKGRMDTLTDFLDWADYIFLDNVNFDEEARKTHLSLNRKKEFVLLSDRLKSAEPFNAATAEKIFRDLVAELGITASDMVHPVRVALTGRAVGPGLFETMVILGKDKTVKRLQEAFK